MATRTTQNAQTTSATNLNGSPTTDIHLGPLTTTFTAAPPCSSITISYDAEAGSYFPFVYPRLFKSIASTCFPSGYPLGNAVEANTYYQYGYQDQHVYFSPGVCPSGWNKNLMGSSTVNGVVETTAMCCQPGLSVGHQIAFQGGTALSTFCESSVVEKTIVTTVAYTGDGALQDRNTKTFACQSMIIPAGGLWIRWKEGDFGGGSGASAVATSATAPATTTGPESIVPSVSPTKTEYTTSWLTGTGTGTGLPATLAHSLFHPDYLHYRDRILPRVPFFPFCSVINGSNSSVISSPDTGIGSPVSSSAFESLTPTSTASSNGSIVGTGSGSTSAMPASTKLGLGIGIPVAALGLLALFYLFRKKKNPDQEGARGESRLKQRI